MVVAKVREMKAEEGFNALTDEYENLVEAGVIDPTKVVRSALQNAASIASLLLTTEALVSEIPEEKEEKAPMGGGGWAAWAAAASRRAARRGRCVVNERGGFGRPSFVWPGRRLTDRGRSEDVLDRASSGGSSRPNAPLYRLALELTTIGISTPRSERRRPSARGPVLRLFTRSERGLARSRSPAGWTDRVTFATPARLVDERPHTTTPSTPAADGARRVRDLVCRTSTGGAPRVARVGEGSAARRPWASAGRRPAGVGDGCGQASRGSPPAARSRALGGRRGARVGVGVGVGVGAGVGGRRRESRCGRGDRCSSALFASARRAQLLLLLALLLGPRALARLLLRPRDRGGVGGLAAGRGLRLERLARLVRRLGLGLGLLALELRDARLELAHARLAAAAARRSPRPRPPRRRSFTK